QLLEPALRRRRPKPGGKGEEDTRYAGEVSVGVVVLDPVRVHIGIEVEIAPPVFGEGVHGLGRRERRGSREIRSRMEQLGQRSPLVAVAIALESQLRTQAPLEKQPVVRRRRK